MKATIVKTDSTTVLTDVSVLNRSSKGYIMGSSYQDFGGVYVTDPVAPPKGITIKKTLVNWKDLAKFEILDWAHGENQDTKAILTFRDGKTREVYLFFPSSGESFSSWGSARVSGKLRIGDTVQDVEMDLGRELKSIEIAAK